MKTLMLAELAERCRDLKTAFQPSPESAEALKAIRKYNGWIGKQKEKESPEALKRAEVVMQHLGKVQERYDKNRGIWPWGKKARERKQYYADGKYVNEELAKDYAKSVDATRKRMGLSAVVAACRELGSAGLTRAIRLRKAGAVDPAKVKWKMKQQGLRQRKAGLTKPMPGEGPRRTGKQSPGKRAIEVMEGKEWKPKQVVKFANWEPRWGRNPARWEPETRNVVGKLGPSQKAAAMKDYERLKVSMGQANKAVPGEGVTSPFPPERPPLPLHRNKSADVEEAMGGLRDNLAQKVKRARQEAGRGVKKEKRPAVNPRSYTLFSELIDRCRELRLRAEDGSFVPNSAGAADPMAHAAAYEPVGKKGVVAPQKKRKGAAAYLARVREMQ